MKILAYILAFSVLFLAIKPGMDSLSIFAQTKQDCCGGGKCTPEQTNPFQEKDDCDGSSCNPFQICSSYVLNVPSRPVDFVLPALFFITDKKATPSFNLFSSFSSDFWQPPRFV